MLTERLKNFQDSFIRLEALIITLENGSAKNVQTRTPQTASPCIRCAAQEAKNRRRIRIFRNCVLSAISHWRCLIIRGN
ncbi:MAG: hypothetical protein V8R43_05390 [Dorea sp.]